MSTWSDCENALQAFRDITRNNLAYNAINASIEDGFTQRPTVRSMVAGC